MKKKLSLIFLSGIILLGFCGCNKNNNNLNGKEQINVNENNDIEINNDNGIGTTTNKEDIIAKLTKETPVDYQLYVWEVSMSSTLGNAIMPNSYIAILTDTGSLFANTISGYIVVNIKVLAVLDKNNKDVFANINEIKTPSKILFYLKNEEVELIEKAKLLQKNNKLPNINMIPSSTSQVSQEMIDYIFNN